jgi:predicted DNA-binding transcriptional regulator AlpA
MQENPPEKPTKSPLFNLEETCAYLKVGRTSIHKLVKKRFITPVNPVPGRTTFLKSDLDNFINSRKA